MKLNYLFEWRDYVDNSQIFCLPLEYAFMLMLKQGKIIGFLQRSHICNAGGVRWLSDFCSLDLGQLLLFYLWVIQSINVIEKSGYQTSVSCCLGLREIIKSFISKLTWISRYLLTMCFVLILSNKYLRILFAKLYHLFLMALLILQQKFCIYCSIQLMTLSLEMFISPLILNV